MIQRGCGHAEASGPSVLGFRAALCGPHRGIPGHRSKDLTGAA